MSRRAGRADADHLLFPHVGDAEGAEIRHEVPRGREPEVRIQLEAVGGHGDARGGLPRGVDGGRRLSRHATRGAQTGLSPAGRSTPVPASPSGPRASARSPRCPSRDAQHLHLAPVGADDLLHDGQPEPGALTVLGREEWLKDVRQLVRGDAGALVDHVNDTSGGSACPRTIAARPSAASTLGPLGHRHRAAGRGGVQGIGQEVDEHLLELVRVAQHGRRAGRHLHPDAHAALAISSFHESITRASSGSRGSGRSSGAGDGRSRAGRARSRRCDRSGSGSRPAGGGPGGRAPGAVRAPRPVRRSR